LKQSTWKRTYKILLLQCIFNNTC